MKAGGGKQVVFPVPTRRISAEADRVDRTSVSEDFGSTRAARQRTWSRTHRLEYLELLLVPSVPSPPDFVLLSRRVPDIPHEQRTAEKDDWRRNDETVGEGEAGGGGEAGDLDGVVV